MNMNANNTNIESDEVTNLGEINEEISSEKPSTAFSVNGNTPEQSAVQQAEYLTK